MIEKRRRSDTRYPYIGHSPKSLKRHTAVRVAPVVARTWEDSADGMDARLLIILDANLVDQFQVRLKPVDMLFCIVENMGEDLT
jgi:hypothetical protein